MSKNKYKWLRGFEAIKQLGIKARDFYRLVDSGKYEDNGKTKTRRKFKIPMDSDEEIETPQDLKEKHLEVKIKKDEQLLYHHKFSLIEMAVEACKEEILSPVIISITEFIRINASQEMLNKWNQNIENILKERQLPLQKALLNLL